MIQHWPLTLLHSAASLVKLFVPLVLVRMFSLEEIGEYKAFFLYLYLVPELFGAAGLVNGLGFWSGEKEKRELFGTAALFVWIGAVISLIAFSLVDISSFLSGGSYYYLAFSLAAFFLLPRMFYEEVLVVEGETWASSKVRFFGELARGLVLVLTAYLTNDLALALLLSSVSLGGELLFYLYLFRGSRYFSLRDASIKSGKKVMSYVLPLMASGVAIIFYERFDQFLLSKIITREEFAIYTIGCLVVPPLLILEQSITRLLIPAISKLRSEESHEKKIAKIYSRSIAQLAFWMIPSALFLSLYSEPIVKLLFTERYIASGEILSLFALIYICMIFPYDVLSRAYGKSRWLFKIYIGSGAVSIALVYILNNLLGVFGALYGLILAQVLVRGYGTYYVKKSLRVSLGEVVPFSILSKISLSAFTGALCSSAVFTLHSSPLFSVLLGGTLYSLGFFVAWMVISIFSKKHRDVSRDTPHVLQITQFLATGGLERLVMNLGLRLNKTGRWRCSVLSYDSLPHANSRELKTELQKGGVSVQQITKGKGFSFKVLRYLLDYISRENVVIIHTHDLGSLIYGALAKVCSFDQPLLIHTQHSFVHLGRHFRYQWYEKIFTLFADAVVPVSESIETIYENLGVPKRRMHVIKNGVVFPPTRKYSPLTIEKAKTVILKEEIEEDGVVKTLQESRYWITYVARIHPGKGQEEAIDLWNNLPERIRTQSSLIFVGPSRTALEFESLLRRSRDARDGERIVFTGHTDRAELWYQSSVVSLSCSDFEGHPLVPIEAIGNGSAFLASDIYGHHFLKRYATLYEHRAPHAGALALAHLVFKLENYPDLWFRERNTLSELIRAKYSFDNRTLGSYESLYLEVGT